MYSIRSQHLSFGGPPAAQDLDAAGLLTKSVAPRQASPMPRTPYLTNRERTAVQALLVDLLVVRCRRQETDLKGLLVVGLGIPEVALPPVVERAREDEEELRRLVARYVTTLSDERLIDELRRSAPDSRSLERLAFDPFDAERANAYRSAARIINPKQALVGAIAGIVVGLMILFPPREELTREKRTTLLILPEKSLTLERRFAGYGFLFFPAPSRTLEKGPNDRGLYGDRWVVQEYWIDLKLLGLEIAGTATLAGVAAWLLRTRPYRAEDYARGPAKGP